MYADPDGNVQETPPQVQQVDNDGSLLAQLRVMHLSTQQQLTLMQTQISSVSSDIVRSRQQMSSQMSQMSSQMSQMQQDISYHTQMLEKHTQMLEKLTLNAGEQHVIMSEQTKQLNSVVDKARLDKMRLQKILASTADEENMSPAASNALRLYKQESPDKPIIAGIPARRAMDATGFVAQLRDA